MSTTATPPRARRQRPQPSGAPLLVLALDREQAAAACNIGLSTFAQAVQQGLLPKPRQIRGCARWPVAELEAALLALPESELLPPPKEVST